MANPSQTSRNGAVDNAGFSQFPSADNASGPGGLTVRQVYNGPSTQNFFIFQHPGQYAINMQGTCAFGNCHQVPASQVPRTPSIHGKSMGTNTSFGPGGHGMNGGD